VFEWRTGVTHIGVRDIEGSVNKWNGNRDIAIRDFPITIRLWAIGARTKDRWQIVVGVQERVSPRNFVSGFANSRTSIYRGRTGVERSSPRRESMPKGVGDRRIGDPEDVESIHFAPAKSEAPIQWVLWSHGPGGLAEGAFADRELENRGGRFLQHRRCRFPDGRESR
jgi:hypothetical protein